MTTRYLILPTVVTLVFGVVVGWHLRAGRATPRDVWDDAKWLGRGFEDGLKIRGLSLSDVQPKTCPTTTEAASRVTHVYVDKQKHVSINFSDGSLFYGAINIVPAGICDDAVCDRGERFIRIQYSSHDDCLKNCVEEP